MKYEVRVVESAERAILEQALFIAADKRLAAEKWLGGIWEAIDDLETMPRRHPLAEALSRDLGVETRRLIFGNYVMHFSVDDASGVVEVLQFRHGRELPDTP